MEPPKGLIDWEKCGTWAARGVFLKLRWSTAVARSGCIRWRAGGRMHMRRGVGDARSAQAGRRARRMAGRARGAWPVAHGQNIIHKSSGAARGSLQLLALCSAPQQISENVGARVVNSPLWDSRTSRTRRHIHDASSAERRRIGRDDGRLWSRSLASSCKPRRRLALLPLH